MKLKKDTTRLPVSSTCLLGLRSCSLHKVKCWPQVTGHLTRNSLTLSHSLGYDCTRRNNLHVLDERTLLYASGNLLHFLDVDTGALRCRPAARWR